MSGSGKSTNSDEYPHHDFEVIYTDPNGLEIDDVNERTTNTGPRTERGNLERSIAENGIEDPPQARPVGGSNNYKVFAGQRRVKAAQAVGIGEIPVIIKDLDDMEALAASVNENNEHLKKDVGKQDRAVAIETLRDEWEIDEIAEYFGVEPQTIYNWREPARDFWKDTIFDPDEDSDLNTEYIANDVLAGIRRRMGAPQLAERIAKMIIKAQIPKKIVRNALDTTEDPSMFVRNIREQWESVSSGEEYIQVTLTFTGDNAKKLKQMAKDRGMNIEEKAEDIIETNLR